MSAMERRKRIGTAFWLLSLLCGGAPDEWNWSLPIFVGGGVSITDAELGQRLGVRPRTIAAWRRKLRALGILRWMSEPGVAGRYFILQRMELLWPQLELVRVATAQAAPERPREEQPSAVKTWVQ